MSAITDPDRFYKREVWPLIQSLRGLAKSYTRDEAEAEELLQQVAIRAWPHVAEGRIDPHSNLGAWLRVIVINTGANWYRKRQSEAKILATGPDPTKNSGVRERVQPDFISEEGVLPGFGSQRPSVDDTIDQSRATAVTRERIEAAIASLPEHYAVPLRLHDLEGLAYQEVADAQGVPVGTVMSRIFRGRERLHALLYDHARSLGYVTDDAPPPGVRVTRFTRTDKTPAAEPDPQLELGFAAASGM